jgi:lambda family phage minor tail protein L
MPLSLTAINEKNALAGESVFYILLEVIIPATPAIYIGSNSEKIVWRGEEWTPFPFEISELSESAKGEAPRWEVRISNHSRVIERYLNKYDNYLKLNGIEGNAIKCNVYIVNSKDLANNEPIRAEYFELLSPKTDKEWASFSLGADSPFNIMTPKRRLIKNFCFWKYKGLECAYAGDLGRCNKTLEHCRARQNSARFGGFAGVGAGGIRI